MSDLNTRLLDAHASDDKHALIGLYIEAADLTSDDGSRGFYLTQAFVFSLETGDVRSDALHASLVAMGREA